MNNKESLKKTNFLYNKRKVLLLNGEEYLECGEIELDQEKTGFSILFWVTIQEFSKEENTIIDFEDKDGNVKILKIIKKKIKILIEEKQIIITLNKSQINIKKGILYFYI
jgi:hypothetical protein